MGEMMSRAAGAMQMMPSRSPSVHFSKASQNPPDIMVLKCRPATPIRPLAAHISSAPWIMVKPPLIDSMRSN